MLSRAKEGIKKKMDGFFRLFLATVIKTIPSFFLGQVKKTFLAYNLTRTLKFDGYKQEL